MQIDRRNPETWPYTLYMKDVQEIMGIGSNKVLELFHKPEFPKKMIGKRPFVLKPQFLEYLNKL